MHIPKSSTTIDALTLQTQQVTVDDKPRWESVTVVYHATEETKLVSAEKSESLKFLNSDNKTWTSCPCSLFSCNLWHEIDGSIRAPSVNGGRPGVSPFASNRVVIPSSDLLANPGDYLFPINDVIATDPDQTSSIGRSYLEMVYVRRQDIDHSNPELTWREWNDLEAWKLENHPFVRLDGNTLRYRVMSPNVWWMIFTPYEVLIPGSAIWELGIKGRKIAQWPRKIEKTITLKLVRHLSIFEGPWRNTD